MVAMIYGASGTGKSTSLRNLPRENTSIINVLNKPFPFRKAEGFKVLCTSDFKKIRAAIERSASRIIVIDDCTHLLTNDVFSKIEIKSFDKYTTLAKAFWELVVFCGGLDKHVYFMGLAQTDEFGNDKFKTVGKMLDNTMCVESYFTIVLKTVVQNGQYFFATHNNGHDTVKSPLGMFEADLIENDLLLVDNAISEYYK